jgi:hypothetical protein
MAVRIWTGLGLGLSGALVFAASWQRWAGVCAHETATACVRRQDHLYDFLPPMEPWKPVGHAAELGGLSLLVFAAMLPLLPYALTDRRPGRYAAVALVVAVLATGAVGAATLSSGRSGEVVAVPLETWTVAVWAIVPSILVGRWAVTARGWELAAGVVLIASLPIVAVFYSIGDYDGRPWQEATSGVFMAVAGLCLIVAAVWRRIAGAAGPGRAGTVRRQHPSGAGPTPASGSRPAAS